MPLDLSAAGQTSGLVPSGNKLASVLLFPHRIREIDSIVHRASRAVLCEFEQQSQPGRGSQTSTPPGLLSGHGDAQTAGIHGIDTGEACTGALPALRGGTATHVRRRCISTICLLPLPCPALALQPCLEKASLGRKQTLTYLRGYQHDDPDKAGLMSCDGPARGPSSPGIYSSSSGAAAAVAGTYGGSSCGSPKIGSSQGGGAPSTSGGGCSSPLPKWVELDRQVRR